MAKSGYFQNCVKAIRQTTFGRDNRKPIADAIEKIKGQADAQGWVIRTLRASVEELSTSQNTYILNLSNEQSS